MDTNNGPQTLEVVDAGLKAAQQIAASTSTSIRGAIDRMGGLRDGALKLLGEGQALLSELDPGLSAPQLNDAQTGSKPAGILPQLHDGIATVEGLFGQLQGLIASLRKAHG